MRFTAVFAAGLQLSAVMALPVDGNGRVAALHQASAGGAAKVGDGAAAAPEASPEAGAGEEAGGEGEGEENENEIELQVQFDEAVALEGGDIKQDATYPEISAGVFEVEFQNTAGNTLTVTENKTPTGAAPAGFDFLETSSFVVSLADDASGATLQKIDFILNAANGASVADGDVGKLDAATGTFVIGADVGELEREVEEIELSLKVADLNGEWAIFKPSAAGGDAGAGAGAGAGGEADAGAGATTGSALLDSVLRLIGEGAATAGVAVPASLIPAAGPAAPVAPAGRAGPGARAGARL